MEKLLGPLLTLQRGFAACSVSTLSHHSAIKLRPGPSLPVQTTIVSLRARPLLFLKEVRKKEKKTENGEIN